MIRGTTAQFKFKLPCPMSELEWVTIKFWQPNNPNTLLPITKKLDYCFASDKPNELCVALTAEETSRFLDKFKAKTQIRAKHMESGAVFGCKPVLFTVDPMRDDIIEENPMLPEISDEGFIRFDGGQIIPEQGGDT